MQKKEERKFIVGKSAKTTRKTRPRRTTILKSVKETAYSLEKCPVEGYDEVSNEHLAHKERESEYTKRC
jgi:hypothetical protein